MLKFPFFMFFLLSQSMDPRIRIHNKMSWIRNTDFLKML